LLILAYHGVSQDDEHLWDPKLFVSPECFATRMQALKHYGPPRAAGKRCPGKATG